MLIVINDVIWYVSGGELAFKNVEIGLQILDKSFEKKMPRTLLQGGAR